MRQGKTFILFKDKSAVESNSAVADVSIEKLCKLTKPELTVEREFSIPGRFDRALLHLDDDPLKEFVNSINHSFIALRLTTARPGVPLSKAHILKDSPTRVVLAVRRMDVLDEADVWNAFLNASLEDCIAICAGRIGDVKREVSALTRLFVEREELIPALIILCEAYCEAHVRASTGGSEWKVRATRTETASWWLKALERIFITRKSANGEEERVTFESARRQWKNERGGACSDPADPVPLLIDRFALEAFQWNSDAQDGVRPLLKAVAADSKIKQAVVSNALDQLKALIQ